MTRFISIPRSARVFASANPSIADVLAKVGEVTSAAKAFQTRFTARLDAIDAELRDQNSRRETAKALGAGAPHHGDAEARRAFLEVATGRVQAASTSDGPDGGYLVPTEIDRVIRRLIQNDSVMRTIARIVPTTRESYTRLFNVGGTEAFWVTEKEARGDTANAKYAKLETKCFEMFTQPAATQQILDDAMLDMPSELERDIALAFGQTENAAFVSGDGVKEPKGFLDYNTVANASWAWGKLGFVATGDASGFVTTTASVNPADCLIDLVYSLKSGYRRNASWLMNSNTVAIVRKFKDNDGRFLWSDSIVPGQPPTLLGYPVYVEEEMPNVGAGEFPIAFGDFARGYVIVDRFGTRLLIDPYTQKPWVKFYATRRVGGGVDDFAAIKLLKVASS